jgi:hypothetical protein
MIALLKNTILNNLTIKIFSLIIGYCLWSFLGSIYLQTNTVHIPICFYNVPNNRDISAQPETITIQLRGKRSDLKQCSDLALHINAQSLTVGQHKIIPEDDQLFLPKTVNMVHYKPLTINLQVTEKIV